MQIQISINNYKRPYKINKIKTSSLYFIAKRITDITFSLIAIILLSPLMILVALLIIIDDPKGSPLFIQKRTGKNGKEFNFYKFRSMAVDAEDQLSQLKKQNEVDGPVFKIKKDPRITKIGYFIRNSSLDELPQLFNIIKGDMSLVGPRPPIPREVKQYDAYHMQRLLAKPGLTCYWQVLPNRHELPFDEWVALDLKYVEERNYLLDLKLIYKTIFVALSCNAD